MHKIERLLQTLAPKGVEFKTLEEVFEIKNGYTPSKNNPEFWEKGTIPWFRMEDIRENVRILKDSIQHITPKALKGKKLFPKNSIIISTTATIGEHALLIVDSLANQRFTFLSKKANCNIVLDMKFFFYQCFLLGEWCKKNTNVSGFASVDMTAFKKYKFPIPPLEIQQEIVKILDAFTELNTELKARKKQYEYYQNMLLDFKDTNQNHKDAKMSAKTYPKRLKTLLQTLAPKGVEFRKLGDIGEYIRGVTYKKNQEINNLECGIKVLRANNITLSNHLNFEDIKVINKNVKIRKEQYLKKNDILICAGSGSSEHIGKVAFINTDFDYVFGGFMGVIRIREVNSRFVYHIFTSNIFKQYLEKSLNTTTINNLNANILQNFLIPIPPLEIQQEIVKILDQFSTLTTDLLAGIPAEIEARKKQYQYYREKLLTFKPIHNKA
ncbi:anti-codon nuclease masking agent (prrB) [Helicobacter pylori]|uniref:restriction endonuclease subunit S n=1 Tax=Helicobacter pylori TaxID=210 RepID=UPI001AA9D2A2|nr:restriction endonuclease subunit S [Helicobacter pylori]GHQ81040.1 anti-codon nuclease masking agent (prrB) [Helicobacter pylori]GHQ81209.1 anti-codon nuclease masking agent (prrB) [Helicobacter pylori]